VRANSHNRVAQIVPLRASATAALVALSGLGAVAGLWKLLGIAWIAFAAMTGGALTGERASSRHARGLVWSYGLTGGAMLTSAAVFLVPPAVEHDAVAGGFGVALGLIAGFALHTSAHLLTHHRRALPLAPIVIELTAHALAAGAVIGVVYGNMPDLGLLLGLAIVSHKAPAGYVAARRLTRRERPVSVLLAPASAVGLAALPSGLLALPEVPAVNALAFGFGAGVFLHVAMDFLPRCEVGSEIYEAADLSSDAHHRLDRLRVHAAVSTALGGAVVFGAWLAVHP
jgi:ZIP family zinc transporter